MHTLVRGAEGITGFFHQLLLEGEVRHGVVDQFVDHIGHRHALQAFLRDMQVVEHLHDAHVLMVNDLDTGVEVILPNQ
ncbi:hypothetical protein D3C81_1856970 [compost metagenome]